MDVGRNNVLPQVVNTLSEENMIEVQTKHVKGFNSIKKVYTLSPAGFQTAIDIKQEVEATGVTVLDFDEDARDRGVEDRYVPSKEVYVTGTCLGRRKGEVDCTSFHEGKIRDERSISISLTGSRP